MVFVYVLQLANNKYYVGKTNDPTNRIKQHFNLTGAQWTIKYKPLNILKIIYNCDAFDEDKYTLKYMKKFGINNVRGGSFCELILNDNDILFINKMLNGATDKCYNCGKYGHYVKSCKITLSKCNYCDQHFETCKDVYYHENFICIYNHNHSSKYVKKFNS